MFRPTPNHIHLPPLPIPPLSAPHGSSARLHRPRRPPLFLIYFITGNPGLVAYYDTFLRHLHARLSASLAGRARIEVYARSFAGFEVDGSPAPPLPLSSLSSSERRANGTRTKRPEDVSSTGRRFPLGLQAQIEDVEARLWRQVMRREEEEEAAEGGGDARVNVVLMGHSVGAYVLMELMKRAGDSARGKAIVGGVCLFPTVVDIAKSQSGRTLGLLLSVYPAMLIGNLLVRFLIFWIPSSVAYMIIRVLMRFPSDAARVTTAFVKSKWGIQTASHMSHEEMHTITTDRWGDEIWGAAKALGKSSVQPHRSKLFFLFGKEDHWVANNTRDTLIKVRGRRRENGAVGDSWKPLMDVDMEEGWQHGFCIRQSVPVAERVVEYIEEIVNRHEDGV